MLGGTALGLRVLRRHALVGPGRQGLPQPPQGAGVTACSMPERYPGFVLDNGVCKPGPATPAGIYVFPDCADFVFVPGDEGVQVQDLEARVEAAVTSSSQADAPSVDPTTIVTDFFRNYWPSCPWPPTGDGPARIVQLYMAMSIVVGRTILQHGGRVLGTVLADIVDEQLATRFGELGLPDFDPSVVPEIELPEVTYGPFPAQGLIPLGPEGGAKPGQGGGVIGPQNVPGQGLVGPGQGPVQPKPLKKCQTTPYAPPAFRNKDLPAAAWNSTSKYEIKIFDFGIDDFSDCKEWSLRFGFCMWPTSGQLYGVLNPDFEQPQIPILIRNEDNTPVDLKQFTWHPVWKRQYQLKVVLENGVAKYVPQSESQNHDGGVDPCQEKQKLWPHPSTGRFLVTAKGGGAVPGISEVLWHPEPYVFWKSVGKKFYAVVFYSGMPMFQAGCRAGEEGGDFPCDPFGSGIDVGTYPSHEATRPYLGKGIAAAGQETSFRLDYKVWGIGGWK